ncbi:dihydrofolate reductase family protein [Fulvivirga lutea]|uniref:Dihydrofolate reductase n=1 Tax=Fulvivirga lutea TaxID=2810512 RepID=A0A974WIK5_9BACT|nr:dihydrofolate reductase family protein [Fulvivirga lutea]QSE98569.1 dihydrofolate reductase [Fulvivirga lutea]
MNDVNVLLYISMSLDGYLAGENDDISWLDAMGKEGEDYSYAAFTKNIDKYLVGHTTYKVVKNLIGEFPQSKQYDCYVLSRSKSGKEDGVTFYNGDIPELIESLKKKGGKNIYCDGGGQVVHELMKHDLIDEYIISIIPTILGNGKRLFLGGTLPLNIELVSSKGYETGLVQNHYVRKR